jgi:hypothetical protein
MLVDSREKSMGKLPDSKRKDITERIRGPAPGAYQEARRKRTLRKVPTCRRLNPLVGSARYGRYRLCNDCALEYDLALAEGKVKNIEDFIAPE